MSLKTALWDLGAHLHYPPLEAALPLPVYSEKTIPTLAHLVLRLLSVPQEFPVVSANHFIRQETPTQLRDRIAVKPLWLNHSPLRRNLSLVRLLMQRRRQHTPHIQRRARQHARTQATQVTLITQGPPAAQVHRHQVTPATETTK